MTKRTPPEIPLEELRKRFHMPLAEVAKEFGVCMTFIKKVCRAAGIKRWPYRKVFTPAPLARGRFCRARRVACQTPPHGAYWLRGTSGHALV